MKSWSELLLVGREEELKELTLHLNSAMKGRSSTIFVSGEAGSGKTRLINEFLRLARKKPVAVLYGWCINNVAVPYFPFTEAFNTYFRSKSESKSAFESKKQVKRLEAEIESDEKEIWQWLMGPKHAQKPEKRESLTPEAWKDLTFAAVSKTLSSISAKKTVVILLEDIQWADSASLSLLYYISRILSSERAMIVATFRKEELAVDAEGSPHPLVETLRLMRRQDFFREIKLRNFNSADVEKVAKQVVGGDLDPILVERLTRESQGNALYVIESLRMLAEKGALVRENDLWCLAASELEVPSQFKEIILRRLDILKPEQRRILGIASSIGNQFSSEELAFVLNQDNFEVVENLNAISQSTSLIVYEGDFCRFDHDKTRNIIYDEIPLPLKKAYHERIAQKLETTDKSAKQLPFGEIAFHYAKSGNIEKSSEYSFAAGEDALARYSNAEAVKHFTYLLQTAWKNLKEDQRIIAVEGLGDAYSAMSSFEEAIKTYDQISNSAESDAARLRALRKAVICCYWQGNSDRSLEFASKAERYKAADSLEYARLRLYRGFVIGRNFKVEEGLADMEEALRVFEEEDSLADVAKGLVELSFGYPWDERLEDSLSAALRSVALYDELEDDRQRSFAYGRLAASFMFSGFLQESIVNFFKAVKIGEKVGDDNNTAFHYLMMGLCYAHLRNFKDAINCNLKGTEYAEKTDAHYARCFGYGNLVRDYARIGDIEHAKEFGEKLERIFVDVPSLKTNKNAVALSQRSRIALFSIKGQWKEANDIYEEYMSSNHKLATIADEAGWKAIFAWSLVKQGRTAEANALFEDIRRINEERKTRFGHTNMRAYLMAPRELGVGEEFTVRLDLVNISTKHATQVEVKELINPGFKTWISGSKPDVQNEALAELTLKEIGPFGIEPIKINLQALKPGRYELKPKIVYVDDLGETKTLIPDPVAVTVHSTLHTKIAGKIVSAPILPDRLSTGTRDLDVLLYGGIPLTYAVALISPSVDQRKLLIKRFVEEGVEKGQTTFYITEEPGDTERLAENDTNLCLFVCNPQSDSIVKSLPNIYKFKGVENLTEIDIALTKALRTLTSNTLNPKRACIEIVSEVLLQHQAVVTRKWLMNLIQTLKSRDFTTLAIMNSEMHPQEDIQAIIGIFDGEIRISEKETPDGISQTLRVRKLFSQKYLENEIVLAK